MARSPRALIGVLAALISAAALARAQSPEDDAPAPETLEVRLVTADLIAIEGGEIVHRLGLERSPDLILTTLLARPLELPEPALALRLGDRLRVTLRVIGEERGAPLYALSWQDIALVTRGEGELLEPAPHLAPLVPDPRRVEAARRAWVGLDLFAAALVGALTALWVWRVWRSAPEPTKELAVGVLPRQEPGSGG